jgi:twitching motility protein PilT
MVRLLGNTEPQSQALAHALRGVLCQALLPSVEGERYHLATECLTSNPEVVQMIASGNVSAIRGWMESKAAPGCHTMNASLRALLAAGKVSAEDARNASTNRIGLAERT